MSITGTSSTTQNITNTNFAADEYSELDARITQNALDIDVLDATVSAIESDETVQNTRLTNVETVNTTQNTSLTSILQRITDIYFSGNETLIYNALRVTNPITGSSGVPQISVHNSSTETANQISFNILAGVEATQYSPLCLEGDCLLMSRLYNSGSSSTYMGGLVLSRWGTGGMRISFNPVVTSRLQSGLDMSGYELIASTVTVAGMSIKPAIDSLGTRVTALEAIGDVNAAQNTTLATHTSQIATLTSDNNAQNTTLINHANQLTSITSVNNSQNTRLTALETDVTALENNTVGRGQYGNMRPHENEIKTEFIVFSPVHDETPAGMVLAEIIGSAAVEIGIPKRVNTQNLVYRYGFRFLQAGLYKLSFSWRHSANYQTDTHDVYDSVPASFQLCFRQNRSDETLFPTNGMENIRDLNFKGYTNQNVDGTNGIDITTSVEVAGATNGVRFDYSGFRRTVDSDMRSEMKNNKMFLDITVSVVQNQECFFFIRGFLTGLSTYRYSTTEGKYSITRLA